MPRKRMGERIGNTYITGKGLISIVYKLLRIKKAKKPIEK
jgi:hypothetical protein